MENNRLNSLLAMYDENNHDSFILFAIAKEYEYLHDIDQSILHFNKLREKDPQYVGLYYHLAKLLEQKNNNQEALEVYEKGIVVAKKQADFHALSELNNAKLNLEMNQED